MHSPKAHRRQVELEQRAWHHHQALTPSEARPWRALRSRQLGVQFRRQVPLCGRYIADFLAPQAQLIVEVDGSSHRLRQQADARRDRLLARQGFRTLRIPAALVMRDLAAAVGLVRAALGR